MQGDGVNSQDQKVAVVTGASQGIGKEIALQLAATGALVFVNYSKSEAAAQKVVEEIRDSGGKAHPVRADVCDEKQVASMFKRCSEVTSHIDYLVNNAGIDIPQKLEEYDLDAWRKIIDVNVTGKFIALKYAIPLLKNSRSPRVVNIASRLAWKPLEEASSYCCSEAAIIMLTKCAALELSPYGIRVNAVCPGFTRTPLTEGIYPDEQIWNQAAERNPSKRVGMPKDVANAVMFLLSDAADYINGTHLLVEGGSMLK